MNDDTIYREAAIDAMWELQGRAGSKGELVGISKAWKRIEKLPSVQPEIIRCKDCKHFLRGISCVGGFYDGCDELTDNGNEMPVDEDFYCGYAERKTDE